MNSDSKIFVARHRGHVGSAIVRRLEALGYLRIVVRTRSELDLSEQAAVRDFLGQERPDAVFLAAAKVCGILANDNYHADFDRENLGVQTNVIDSAWRSGVSKLVFLGSSWSYPKFTPQPSTGNSPLEPTNEWYAIAKIAGVKMCGAYRKQHGFNAISLMPTNLYGPGDNFDLSSSHVLPALLRKFHDAKLRGDAEVTVWGSGQPRREFMHVDDFADACVHLFEVHNLPGVINVGVGTDVSIAEAARLIRETVGFQGRIVYGSTKPDGTPRKLLDVSKLKALGWSSKIGFREGVESTCRWFLDQPIHRGD